MLHIILNWILSALILLLLSAILPGFRLRGLGTALVAVIVIGFLNATLGIVLQILALPFTILTLGLFVFVVQGIILKVAAALIPGFEIVGCLPAIVAAILLAVIHLVVGMMSGPAYHPWRSGIMHL